MDRYNFLYCQKLVIFSKDRKKVLLGKRKGEAEYNDVFSFFGGKMETTDKSIFEGVKREKDEELGEKFKVAVYPLFTYNLYYAMRDGRRMILPHYYAVYVEGEIVLSGEYSEARWVPIAELGSFEPKVETIPEAVKEISKQEKIIRKEDLVVI